jgi:hypothetical protein
MFTACPKCNTEVYVQALQVRPEAGAPPWFCP